MHSEVFSPWELPTSTAPMATMDGDGKSCQNNFPGVMLITCRIFIIEGCITVTVIMVAYLFMSDWPETCKWLTKEEKEVLADHIRQDGTLGRMDRLDPMAIKRIVSDWKVYVW
jgi:hypothetical protein